MIQTQGVQDFFTYYKKHRENVVIFYHTDGDGVTSAWLLKTALFSYMKAGLPIKLVPYNYAKDFSFKEHITPNSGVIVVDLSLRPEQLMDIELVAKQILVLDHHITSEEWVQEAAKESIIPFEYIIDTDRCGAMISYDVVKDFKNGVKGAFGEHLNYKSIYLVDQYDRWVFGEDKTPVYFNTFLWESGQLSPYGFFMGSILMGSDKVINDAIESGKKLYEIQQSMNEVKCDSYGHEIDYDGFRAFVAYGSGNSSLFGDRIHTYDIVIRKVIHDDMMTVSLYTEKDIDVSKLAKAHGGGGHPKAAGYTVKLKR